MKKKKRKKKTSVGVFGNDSKHNIWMLVKDGGSRRMLPWALLFIFDRICHVNSLLHSWWGCFYCTDPTQILWRSSQVSLFHPKWEKKKKKKQLKDLRFNAQLLGCRTAVWQNASAAQECNRQDFHNYIVKVFWQAAIIWYHKTCYLTSQGRDVNYKTHEIEEVTMIYCDKGRGGAIAEECERNTEVSVQKPVRVWSQRLCCKRSVISSIRSAEGKRLIHTMGFKDRCLTFDSYLTFAVCFLYLGISAHTLPESKQMLMYRAKMYGMCINLTFSFSFESGKKKKETHLCHKFQVHRREVPRTSDQTVFVHI